MKNIPTRKQLLRNFMSCSDWQEKYRYIIDLGQLLSKFPENLRTKENLIIGCQSRTWISIKITLDYYNSCNIIKFYGDSDAIITKGVIVIIFSMYKNLDIKSIISFDAKEFLNKLQINQNLTTSRSQGVYFILNAIYNQVKNFSIKS